uniref:phenylalanine 4-monooxygenase n=1 Tax=Dunaliella tertiolecta TaxID=3047 RepID=A0A7S3QR79_DUNTE
MSRTGWQIRPVAGLLHPRDFLAGLAFKYFHSTQYLRHHSQPSYTPEPDLVHECLGHMPMLANQEYADLVQAIGEVSLGANEKMIWHLTKVYWYTVEFGLIREEDKVKAFGAGVLSSYGELQHMARIPELLPFDPFQKLPKMSYKDGYQKAYYVLNSFEDAEQKLRELARAMKDPLHPFSL